MGLDFALRCAAADHSVKLYRYSKKPTKTGEGFPQIQIVDDWKSHMGWAKNGLIITTGNNKFITELDRYRDLGFKIFAPTAKSAELEIKRSVGMEAMKKAGIDIPEYQVFDSLQAAEKFARKSDRPFVFKPMGDEEDKSLTYVASDPADLVGWLNRQIKAGKKLKGQCMLQEKIDMLSEFGISGWFGPEGFLPDKWQICFEHKKLMPGDKGPNTGEMGTATQYTEKDKLAEMMEPLVPLLKKLGHRGDFSIGAGIDTSGKAWPFEFTARLGWPAFYIQVASHKGDPCKWMRDLLDGKDSLKVSYDAAIGVVMAQPPFPYEDGTPEEVEGNPISGLEHVWDDIHPAEMMMGKGPIMQDGKVVDGDTYQTSGSYVLIATGLGATVSKAMKKAYETANEVKYSNPIVRTDIGAKLEETLPELHKFGYATDLDF